MSVGPLALIVAVVLTSGQITPVNAHGFLRTPKPRNVAFFNDGRQTNGNSKGYKPYPSLANVNNGPCGDPFQDLSTNFVNQPGEIQANYTMGATIDLVVDVTANHGGFFEYRLCPRRTGLTNECFESNKLERCVSTTTILVTHKYPCVTATSWLFDL
jgi:hypothetical protein